MSVQQDFFEALLEELKSKGVDDATAEENVKQFKARLLEKAETEEQLDAALSKIPPASIAENILTVGNIGTTTLTAQVPGTDDYAEASLTVPVTVRYETAGCEDILLYGPTTEPIQFFQFKETKKLLKIQLKIVHINWIVIFHSIYH